MRERERERGTPVSWLGQRPDGVTHSLGVRPARGLNLQPFAHRTKLQPTGPSGRRVSMKKLLLEPPLLWAAALGGPQAGVPIAVPLGFLPSLCVASLEPLTPRICFSKTSFLGEDMLQLRLNKRRLGVPSPNPPPHCLFVSG